MRKLITTADDYGLCASVNQAIEECLDAGALRATCVMANMPAATAATALRARFQQASIGLHWTLTTGRPLAPPAQVASLVGPDGNFWPFLELRRRILARQIVVAHVLAELSAQFERFRELCGQPDFWNTHQNIHIAPGLFDQIVELGRHLGIALMRSHRRITVPLRGGAALYNLRHPAYWLKGLLIGRWSTRAAARGMRMPDGIVHAPGFGAGKSQVEAIAPRMARRAGARAAELVIHPATQVEPELFGNLTETRLREYAVFRDPGLRQRLAAAGIETVGFEVLHDG
jgi:predicted glycoside hydrolase/deacetylase ChbG (UPF0249 family)